MTAPQIDGSHTLFHPVVAGALDNVVEAMNLSHDEVIRLAGNRRTSGVWWELYGPPLAAILAGQRARGGGEPLGDWKAGISRLEALLDETTVDTVDFLAELIAFAIDFPSPTLVLAFCRARPSSAERRASRLNEVDAIVLDELLEEANGDVGP